jgi:hypothetical protein
MRLDQLVTSEVLGSRLVWPAMRGFEDWKGAEQQESEWSEKAGGGKDQAGKRGVKWESNNNTGRWWVKRETTTEAWPPM